MPPISDQPSPMPSRDGRSRYQRTIRFHETDAAGVVYFANILTLCHEAYEVSLAAAGINVQVFFGGDVLAVPIVHAAVDFRRPLYCGDQVAIALTSQCIDDTTFEINYCLSNIEQKTVATATTRHVCINSTSRQRHSLSPELRQWLLANGPLPGSD